jgi:hypothetical protein
MSVEEGGDGMQTYGGRQRTLPRRAVRSRVKRRLPALLILTLVATGAASGTALAAGLSLPIRIDTRISLREQFGYAPDYERNVPSFDPSNRPYIRSRTASQHVTDHVHAIEGGGWTSIPLLDAIRRDYPSFVATVNAGGYVSELVEFDRQGRAYTLLEIRLKDGSLENVLAYSVDGCRSWRTMTLPFGGRRTLYDGRDGGTATLEHFSGWNVNDGPPLVAVWRPVADWVGPRASRSELYVVAPRFEGDRLTLPPPTLVSRRFLGMVQAAGGASFAATAGDRSFIVWTEIAPRDAEAAPTFVASFEHASRTLGAPVRVGMAKPANDEHCTPGICLDGGGHLHVIIGAHSQPFLYTRSVEPLDAGAWTAPKRVLTSGYRDKTSDADGRGEQTYVSLVCLPDDTLVLVFRQQRAGVDRVFGGRSYGVLCMQRRPRGGPWSGATRLVFRLDRCGYAMFHHKLAVDRQGRLFLSLSYFNPTDYPLAKRAQNRYHHRMVLVSTDAGATWRFAASPDYLAGATGPFANVASR